MEDEEEPLVMLAETLDGIEVTDEEIVLVKVEVEAWVELLEVEIWLVEVDVAVAAFIGVANAQTQATSTRRARQVDIVCWTARTT